MTCVRGLDTREGGAAHRQGHISSVRQEAGGCFDPGVPFLFFGAVPFGWGGGRRCC